MLPNNVLLLELSIRRATICIAPANLPVQRVDVHILPERALHHLFTRSQQLEYKLFNSFANTTDVSTGILQFHTQIRAIDACFSHISACKQHPTMMYGS